MYDQIIQCPVFVCLALHEQINTVSMLVSSTVDRGFIDGVMVSMLVWSAVDRGFIDGVMVPNAVIGTHYQK